MLKFLKNLFSHNNDEEVFYEYDVKVTLNRKEGTLIIDTLRDLSEDEIKDLIRRYK